MTDYTRNTNYSTKDTLPSGNNDKIIRGTELQEEFDDIQTAVNSKANSTSPVITGTATAEDLSVSGTLNSTGTLEIDGVAVTSTAEELNILDGVTATTAEVNKLAGVTATTAEINKLNGVTVTPTEINSLGGVTGVIQTRLNTLENLDADDFGSGTATDSYVLTADGAGNSVWEALPEGGIDANNPTINLTAGDGLSGGGSFTLNQSFNENISFDVDSTVDYEEFLTSGTWTKPANINYVYVEVIGSGAGGKNGKFAASVSEEGSGGGGGEFVSRLLRASEVPSSVSVDIGAGGLGGADGTGDQGADGSQSSFGTLAIGLGGKGTANVQVGGIPRGTGFMSKTSRYVLENVVHPQAGFGSIAHDSIVRSAGNTIYGGAGGGGGAAGGGSQTSGGVSQFGGNGGDGNKTANTRAGDGVVPGGGGGGSSQDGGGGNGASGRVRVWAW